MKILLKIIVLFLITFGFSGCFSNYDVYFDSNPRGATVQCGNKVLGYAPIWAHINIPKEDFVKFNSANGSLGCHATWLSGYQKEYKVKIDFDKYPDRVGINVERPVTDGYEKDVQFALQVQKMQTATENTTDAIQLNNAINSVNNLQPQINNYLRAR